MGSAAFSVANQVSATRESRPVLGALCRHEPAQHCRGKATAPCCGIHFASAASRRTVHSRLVLAADNSIHASQLWGTCHDSLPLAHIPLGRWCKDWHKLAIWSSPLVLWGGGGGSCPTACTERRAVSSLFWNSAQGNTEPYLNKHSVQLYNPIVAVME